jgi:hypothetical protein
MPAQHAWGWKRATHESPRVNGEEGPLAFWMTQARKSHTGPMVSVKLLCPASLRATLCSH